MYESLKAGIIRWNDRTTERAKLQQTYLAIIIVLIIVAGLVTLLNPLVGHNMIVVAIACALAFILNGVVWHLLNSLLISRLPRPVRSTRRK